MNTKFNKSKGKKDSKKYLISESYPSTIKNTSKGNSKAVSIGDDTIKLANTLCSTNFSTAGNNQKEKSIPGTAKSCKTSKRNFRNIGIEKEREFTLTRVEDDQSIPYSSCLTSLTNIVEPMRKSFTLKNKSYKTLEKVVGDYEKSVKDLSQELQNSQKNSYNFKKNSNGQKITIFRYNSENKSINDEILLRSKENCRLRNEINKVNKEKIIMTNEYINTKHEIDEMKKLSIDLSNANSIIIEEKKALKSAIILMNKKVFELRNKNNISDNKERTIVKEVEYIKQLIKGQPYENESLDLESI